MEIIVDILRMYRDDISIFSKQYPGSSIVNITNTDDIIQDYSLIIQSEDVNYESYFNFLVDSMLAMASSSFRLRCERDVHFKIKMISRVAASIVEINQAQKTDH